MNKDAESLATRMLDAVKAYVARAVVALDVRFVEFDARIKAIPAGPKGDSGNAGKDGGEGLPGKSAYALAVERGFAGTELQWLDSIKGDRGDRGEKGERGESVQGPKGDRGESGVGEKGLQGARGDKGEKGDEGVRGVKGDLGQIGLTGEQGAKGDKGDRGDIGPDGKDAEVDYDRIETTIKDVVPVAVKEEVTKAVSAIPAPQNGRDGNDAPAVDEDALVERAVSRIPVPKDGTPGRDGESIHPDTVALMVRNAVAAEVQKLPAAKDGAAGRDAFDINPLPSIDETKSYPAGTWARYCGGLIKAVRKTDQITGSLLDAGWEVMVEGLSALVVTQGENLRTFSVAAMLTSGTKAVSDFSVPVLLDRGVYKAGTYGKGDVVTYGGSMWVSLKDGNTTKPPSDSWRCIVQRGKDGKDAQ